MSWFGSHSLRSSSPVTQITQWLRVCQFRAKKSREILLYPRVIAKEMVKIATRIAAKTNRGLSVSANLTPRPDVESFENEGQRTTTNENMQIEKNYMQRLRHNGVFFIL